MATPHAGSEARAAVAIGLAAFGAASAFAATVASARFGASAGDVAVFSGVASLGGGITGLLAWWWTARRSGGKRSIVIAGGVVLVVASIAAFGAAQLQASVALRSLAAFLVGFGLAMVASSLRLVLASVPPGRVARAAALGVVAGAVGSSLGGLIGATAGSIALDLPLTLPAIGLTVVSLGALTVILLGLHDLGRTGRPAD